MGTIKQLQKIAKPLEGAKWDGTEEQAQDIIDWVSFNGGSASYMPKGSDEYDLDNSAIYIHVGDGHIRLREGYWVVQTNPGVFSTHNQDYYEKTYEQIGAVE